MMRRVMKLALAICAGAMLAVPSSAQAAPEQTSSSLDQVRSTPAATVAKPAIPEGTWVEVSITDWGPLQRAAPGTIVPLVVTENVTVNGVIAIEAGTRLTGVIEKQKHGTHWLDSDGKMQLEARDLKTSGPIPIYRRSVLEALHGPSTTRSPESPESHSLKVLAISTGTGFVLGLLPNPQNTNNPRLTNGAICAGLGLFIGTMIELPHPDPFPFLGLPRLGRVRLHLPVR